MLTALGGQRLKPRGKATLLCKYNCQFWPINFEVLDGVSNVLGLRTSEEMGLIKRVGALSNDIISQYADNFTRLGCISDVTHYMFKRLPFGISSAQDIFQSIMSQIFEDIERVEVIVDDVLVWGSDIAEHDQRLQKVPNNATSS